MTVQPTRREPAPPPVRVDVTVLATRSSGAEEPMGQCSGPPALTAAWLRALADVLDPPRAVAAPTLVCR